ncbi:MAG: hypothetical protein RLZZ347_603 [Candidatus Parcubacteria bacterium]
MKKPKSASRAVATDRKRQVILRSPEIRRALNRALFEIAFKFEPCNLRVTFSDRDNRHVVLQTFHDPDNILFGIPRIGQGELTIDLPDLPWIRKALLDTGGKFTLTELA